MKHLKNALMAVGLMTFVAAAPAMAADSPQYGFVDMGKVVQKTDAAKGIFTELEGKRKEYQEQIKKEEDALEASQNEIKSLREKLSAEEFGKKAKEWDAKFQSGQKMVQEKKHTLDEAYGRSMMKLREEAAKIIAEVAKEKGYSAVFTQDAVIMASQELDITEEVITRMNKNVKKIAVEWKKK